jgi:hypothetical protein
VVSWKGSVGMMKAPSGASSADLERQGSARAFLVNTLPSATTLRLRELAIPPPRCKPTISRREYVLHSIAHHVGDN